jgi:hypothetical protein
MLTIPDDTLECVRVMTMERYFDSNDYPPFYCPSCCRNIYYTLLFEHYHNSVDEMSNECHNLFGIELDYICGDWVVCQECVLEKIRFPRCINALEESAALTELKNMCLTMDRFDHNLAFVSIYCQRRGPGPITKSARNIKE